MHSLRPLLVRLAHVYTLKFLPRRPPLPEISPSALNSPSSSGGLGMNMGVLQAGLGRGHSFASPEHRRAFSLPRHTSVDDGDDADNASYEVATDPIDLQQMLLCHFLFYFDL